MNVTKSAHSTVQNPELNVVFSLRTLATVVALHAVIFITAGAAVQALADRSSTEQLAWASTLPIYKAERIVVVGQKAAAQPAAENAVASRKTIEVTPGTSAQPQDTKPL